MREQYSIRPSLLNNIFPPAIRYVVRRGLRWNCGIAIRLEDKEEVRRALFDINPFVLDQITVPACRYGEGGRKI
jgi:hypothetical protein